MTLPFNFFNFSSSTFDEQEVEDEDEEAEILCSEYGIMQNEWESKCIRRESKLIAVSVRGRIEENGLATLSNIFLET
tara:strand:- start:383 stop:613 length:231 start_codon:yes stop_codon:yes gene_type:complete